jgi:hypothetical protein
LNAIQALSQLSYAPVAPGREARHFQEPGSVPGGNVAVKKITLAVPWWASIFPAAFHRLKRIENVPDESLRRHVTALPVALVSSAASNVSLPRVRSTAYRCVPLRVTSRLEVPEDLFQ